MTYKSSLLVAATNESSENGRFVLPQLPYSHNALAPVISEQTVDFHWGKHIQAYITNLNKLIVGTEFENADLNEMCVKADGGIFNNGAQVWNHIFYFETFSANAQKTPNGNLLDAINRDFGSLEDFKSEFVTRGLGQFGSGWIWLSKNADGKLLISAYPNAGNPIKDGLTPLLGFDVWEHAYYLDYQNRRGDHLSALWDIVDWAVVEKRY